MPTAGDEPLEERRLRGLGYKVLATAGIVANSALGITEVEAACDVRCLAGETILAGGLVSTLRTLRASARPVPPRPAPEGSPAGSVEVVPGTHGASRAAL